MYADEYSVDGKSLIVNNNNLLNRLKRQSVKQNNNILPWIESPFNVTIILTSWYPPAVRVSWQVSNNSLPMRHLMKGSYSSVIDANETNDISPEGRVKVGSFRVAYNELNSV